MHMNSAPHLLTEDRPEFERILDDALRHAHDRPDLASVGERLNLEQLRTMALNATALITAAAAAEYDHYVKARDELRAPEDPLSTRDSDPDPMTDAAAGSGAGVAAVVTVLAPVLAGASAAIFLIVGYLLQMLSPAPVFADTLVAAGWFFGAVTAASILVAAVALLIAALRNSSTQEPAVDEEEGLTEEVSRAREAWRHALLERGLLPFLRDALADPSVDPTSNRKPYRSSGRIPKVGYSGPDFASPNEGPVAGPRPTFTSPDFTSPDYGGPEHQPE
ncbi:hypothetical protein [Streptomyces sp. NPDC050504]|uniref:hypothetical protein n=1 Tax=Streptomyces sp. NPDC050504 TaxID=3365618 RepID=UPI0037B61EDA